ncbi:MAG: ABC transporter transmembrane domain-containing protein, partial [Acidimicrobiales bacterium]
MSTTELDLDLEDLEPGASAAPRDGSPEPSAGADGDVTPSGAIAVLRRGLAASPELRQGLGVTVLLALVGAGGRVIVPIVVQQVVDRGLAVGAVRMGTVWRLAGVATVVVLFTALTNRATHVRLARASEHALYGMRTRAFDHIHRLSVAHHTDEHRGVLVSRVTSDVETLSQFFSWGGLAWIVNGAMMLAVAATMFAYDWRLASITLLMTVPLSLVLRMVQRHLLSAWDLVRTRVGELLSAVSEALMGAAVIRGYGVQDRVTARVDGAVVAHRQANIRAGSLSALLFPSGEVFAVLTVAAVMATGLWLGPEAGLT